MAQKRPFSGLFGVQLEIHEARARLCPGARKPLKGRPGRESAGGPFAFCAPAISGHKPGTPGSTAKRCRRSLGAPRAIVSDHFLKELHPVAIPERGVSRRCKLCRWCRRIGLMTTGRKVGVPQVPRRSGCPTDPTKWVSHRSDRSLKKKKPRRKAGALVLSGCTYVPTHPSKRSDIIVDFSSLPGGRQSGGT